MVNHADPCFSALLAEPRAALRPPQPGRAWSEYRRRLDAPMIAASGPQVVGVENVDVGSLALPLILRSYKPPGAVPGAILFIHGGGFVIGSLETHDALCRSLALESRRRVVAVAYRLAPEAPFPAARDDCRAALTWLIAAEAGHPIAICGDSAGGHLAIRTALDAGHRGITVAALGLLYPVVDPACASSSWDAFGEGYILTREWMRWAWKAYLDGADPSDLSVALLRNDLSALPPTLVLTAACDPLRDEGEALAKAIDAAGGAVGSSCAAGMIHGFVSLPMLTPQAGEAVRQLSSHVSQHMR